MIKINKDLCDKCSTPICTKRCPTGALQPNIDKIGVSLNENKCISCGHCVRLLTPGKPYNCFGLKTPELSINDVQSWIETKEINKFAVSIGPGLEFYSDLINLNQVVGAWRRLGAVRVIKASM